MIGFGSPLEGHQKTSNMTGSPHMQPAFSVQRGLRPPGETAGVIFDVKRYALHDGPGIRTTVFFKGCPLRCRWCHNPESWLAGPERSLRIARCGLCGRCVEACPNGAISGVGEDSMTDAAKCTFCGKCVEACPTEAREIVGRTVTAAEVMAEIERDVIFYDQSGGGATFSGGEPLMQPEFLTELLILCRRREIHTALDTCLHAPWEVLESLHQHVDLFLVDLKQMHPAEHERGTGASNGPILENLRRLARLDKPIIIRVPVIPGVNDGDANLAATGEFVASLGTVQQIDLLPHHVAADGKAARLEQQLDLLHVDPPEPQRMATIAERLKTCGLDVTIGG